MKSRNISNKPGSTDCRNTFKMPTTAINWDEAEVQVRKFLIDEKYKLRCDSKTKHQMRDLRSRIIQGKGIGIAAIVKCMKVMGYEITFNKDAEILA